MSYWLSTNAREVSFDAADAIWAEQAFAKSSYAIEQSARALVGLPAGRIRVINFISNLPCELRSGG